MNRQTNITINNNNYYNKVNNNSNNRNRNDEQREPARPGRGRQPRRRRWQREAERVQGRAARHAMTVRVAARPTRTLDREPAVPGPTAPVRAASGRCRRPGAGGASRPTASASDRGYGGGARRGRQSRLPPQARPSQPAAESRRRRVRLLWWRKRQQRPGGEQPWPGEHRRRRRTAAVVAVAAVGGDADAHTFSRVHAARCCWTCRSRAAAGREASGGQTTFATPDEAVTAFVAAARANNTAALDSMLGPGGAGIVTSSDTVADRAERARFVERYDEKHALVENGKDTLIAQCRRDRLADAHAAREGGRKVALGWRGREAMRSSTAASATTNSRPSRSCSAVVRCAAWNTRRSRTTESRQGPSPRGS